MAGCELFSTCEPCPMCMAAIYWARIDRVYFAATRADAREMGFDDAVIYEEVGLELNERAIPMIHLPMEESEDLARAWASLENRVLY